MHTCICNTVLYGQCQREDTLWTKKKKKHSYSRAFSEVNEDAEQMNFRFIDSRRRLDARASETFARIKIPFASASIGPPFDRLASPEPRLSLPIVDVTHSRGRPRSASKLI